MNGFAMDHETLDIRSEITSRNRIFPCPAVNHYTVLIDLVDPTIDQLSTEFIHVLSMVGEEDLDFVALFRASHQWPPFV